MEYASREVLLKNGRMCVIRRPEEQDAAQLARYLRETSDETPYLTREPEEAAVTAEEEARMLREDDESRVLLRLLAEVDGEMAGLAVLTPLLPRRRLRHRCQAGVAVYRRFWNMGIGTALMEELLESAETAGFEQAELEVAAANETAVRVYRRLGFEVTGTIPHGLKYRDGSYADFLYMVKRLV